MAAPYVNLQAGCDAAPKGDLIGNVVNTSERNLNGAIGITITNETFDNPFGRFATLDNAIDITFRNCTFRNGAQSCITGAQYHKGLIEGQNATNIRFEDCILIDNANAACGPDRNNLIFFDGIDGLTFVNNLVENVDSDISQNSGDRGNRTIMLSGASGPASVTNIQIDNNCFVNPGRNAIQITRARNMANSSIVGNVIIGKGHQLSEFEDMINTFSSSGTAATPLEITDNYMANGGPSRTGTAFIFGDGDNFGPTEYTNFDRNVIVNPGHVGINHGGGRFQNSRDNIVFSEPLAAHSTQTGFTINDYAYTGTTPANNTYSGNRVWFGNQFTGGTNHTWFPNTTGWTDGGGNNFADTSLNIQQLECVEAVDEAGVGAVGVADSFDVGINDISYFANDTYSFISGSLPPGMTLLPSGLLTGTPTTNGIFTFTYRVENMLGQTDTATATYTVGAGSVFAQDDSYTGQAGSAFAVSLTTNDQMGAQPATVAITSGMLPPGLSLTGSGSLTGTPTTAGTYTFQYTLTDANGVTSTASVTVDVAAAPPTNTTTGDCKEIVLYFVTLPEGVNSLADCPELPCIVDENGLPYDLGFDLDGNQCLVIPNPNPIKPAATYVSADGESPPAACCLTNSDIGVPAYDETGECITHICMGENLGWQPMCGGEVVDPPVDPPDPTDTMDRVCYDLAGILPNSYGSGGTWLVSTIDQFADIDCQVGTVTAAPSDTLWTCDYTSYTEPDLAANVSSYNLTSIGGAVVTAEGNGIDCSLINRPTFVSEFASVTGTGPVSVDFDVTSGSGRIVATVYNACTGQYEDIASVSGPTGVSYWINGQALQIDSATGIGAFTIDVQDTNVDPACLQMVWFSLNGEAGTGAETIESVGLNYTAGDGTCCNDIATAADVAALLTAEDPVGNTWTADGNLVCSDMAIGQGGIYGDLQFCEGAASAPAVTTF